jgi:hypothetical protein
MNEQGATAAVPTGDEKLWESAAKLVEAGTTSAQEVLRVLGLRRAVE